MAAPVIMQHKFQQFKLHQFIDSLVVLVVSETGTHSAFSKTVETPLVQFLGWLMPVVNDRCKSPDSTDDSGVAAGAAPAVLGGVLASRTVEVPQLLFIVRRREHSVVPQRQDPQCKLCRSRRIPQGSSWIGC